MASIHPTPRKDSLTRHYSTRDFFRQTPNALLARYFQARGEFVSDAGRAMEEAPTGRRVFAKLIA